jgi:signal transduction histidine kinase
MNRRFNHRDRIAQRARRWDRSIAITLITGLALLLVLGLVFSVAYGSQRITTEASALHTADETLRSTTVVRAQLALAVHMASVDRQFGTNSSSAVDLSVREGDAALGVFASGIAHLYESGIVSGDSLQIEARTYIETSRTILDLLASNEAAAAQELATRELGPRYRAIVDALVALRDDLAESVSASDVLLGRIGNIARFLVAFLVPAAVIFVYRELLRRQQRQTDLENRLRSERQLNAAREQFVANASHELRTPLTSIMGLSMLLAEDEAIRKQPDVADLIDTIIGESDDLARMVEDLLTTARLDSGALHFVFEDIDVPSEAQEIVDPLQRTGSLIGAECEPGKVRADRLRFRQVIRNLISNARKYGGPNIRIVGRIEGRTYVCSVVDDGPGVPTEIEPRLFVRFVHQGHQTATKDSVGLGLSIVHALAQGMGGSVRYERIGNETHFSLRLPLASESPTIPEEGPEQKAAGARFAGGAPPPESASAVPVLRSTEYEPPG